MKIQCPNPKCPNPSNAQSFEMAYKSGVRVGVSQTTGVGVTTAGHLGVGRAKTQSVHTSQVAQETAPPKLEGGGCLPIVSWLIVIYAPLVVLQMLGPLHDSLTLIFLFLAVCCWVLYFRYRRKARARNKKVYEEAYAAWSHSWICNACGTTWQAD
jgi:hypothetical protein